MPSAVAGAVLYAAAGFSATVAASDWSEERIAGLFPAPLEGWASGAVEIEERDTITSGFESFALAPLTETAAVGVRVRLKATRAYSLSEKRITVFIDTKDIESAVSVDGMSAAHISDPVAREKLKDAGVIPFERDGYAGLKLAADVEAGRVFKIGSAGFLSLECSYEKCAADLDQMLDRLDFASIADFVSYDHRR